MTFITPNPLSTEFKIAVEIYHLSMIEEEVSIDTLMENLELSKSKINEGLETLFDWGMITAYYNEDSKDHILYEISADAISIISDLYHQFWYTGGASGQNIGDCPVCGHKVNLYKKDPEARSSLYFIRCSNEDCFFTTLYDDEITLLKWWAGRRINSNKVFKEVKHRIEELEEQIEENNTYRSRELIDHEITTLKWVLLVKYQMEYDE